MTAVRTPMNNLPALELGNRRYRKQVIRVGDLHYRGGKFPITDAYLDDVVKAFDSRAVPSVPFQLADHANRHTEDPERRRGTIMALHRTPDGLDAVIELNDAGARIVDEHPDFGVSVLIEHGRTTGEGRSFPAVLKHVLGTTDPVLTSLEPWRQEIAASHADAGEDVLDLLALTTPDPADSPARSDSSAPMQDAAPSTTNEGGAVPDTDTLAPEDVAALRSLASIAPALAKLVETPAVEPIAVVEDTDDEVELTDAEIQAIADSLDTEDDDTELIAASHEQPSDEVLSLSHKLALAEQGNKDNELRLAQVESELNERRYVAERDSLAREFGVHPRITDIIRPLLEGSGAGQIALSNGAKADPGELVRRFMKELAASPRLDLSNAVGSAVELDESTEDARAKDTEAFLARAKAERNG